MTRREGRVGKQAVCPEQASDSTTTWWPVDAGLPIARWYLQNERGELLRQPRVSNGIPGATPLYQAHRFDTPAQAMAFADRHGLFLTHDDRPTTYPIGDAGVTTE